MRVQAEIALGADPAAGSGSFAWTDASRWIRARNRIQITRGRNDGYQIPQPSKMTCEVDNNLGRWVARNAVGPWYGQIRRNVPIRILCDADAAWPIAVSDTFTRVVASGWGSTDTGQAWTLSGFGGTVLIADWSVSGTAGLVGVPVAGGFRNSTLDAPPLVDADITFSVSCPVPTGNNLEPGNVEFRVGSTGSFTCRTQVLTTSAVQVHIFTPTVTLVSPTTIAGLTHSAGTPLKVRAQVYGTTIRMRVWQGAAEPQNWHASGTSAELGAAGSTRIRCGVASANSNTKPVVFTIDNVVISTPPVRFAGYIDELPVSWDPTARDSTVAISASGFFRRLNQGTGPPRSAVYRTRTSADHHQPIEYWPMEDGSSATSFVNAIADGRAMTRTDQTPASSSAFIGSQALPVWGALGNRASIRAFTATQYAVRHLLFAPAGPAANTAITQWRAGSFTWQIVAGSGAGSSMLLQAFDSVGVERLSSGTIAFGAGYLNKPCQVLVNVAQNGADIDWSLQLGYFQLDGAAGTNTVSGTLTGETIAMPSEIKTLTVGGPLTNWVIGHLAVYDDIGASPLSGATRGWNGNTATEHIRGICRDARIPYFVPNDSDPAAAITTLGPQSIAPTMGLLKDGADADGGILYEADFAVGYLARYRLYNQPVALAVDIAGMDVRDFRPTDDDTDVRNDITVSRTGGSSARATDDDHIALYGTTPPAGDAITLNIEDDSQLADQAFWRLGRGTVDDMRYPGVELDFVANPQLRTAWQAVDVGSRMQVLRPPAALPPDVIELLVQGWQETIDDGGNVWSATLNCTSGLPWLVFQLDAAGNLARLSSGASTLSAGATTTTTSLSVATAAGAPLWPVGAVSPGVDLVCSGEVVKVTSISGSSSPQTFTVTRSVNGVVKALPINAPIDVYRPGRLGF